MNVKQILIALVLSVVSTALAICPDDDVIAPCTCERGDDAITCFTGEHMDLSAIFKNLSKFFDPLIDPQYKHFQEFMFINTDIKELDVSVFGDIWFDALSFDRTNLVSLTCSEPVTALNKTKTITITNNPLLRGDSIVNFVNMFANVESVSEYNNTLFTELSNRAFHKAGIGSKLSQLVVQSPRTVGSYAFAPLGHLSGLYLGNDTIYVAENAFAFDVASNRTLLIDIPGYALNGTGMEKKALSDIKRPVTINMHSKPGLTFLDESVFKPFFKSNDKNRIEFAATPRQAIDCQDCRSYWLKRDGYEHRISHLSCSNGKSFDDQGNFAHCSKSSKILE